MRRNDKGWMERGEPLEPFLPDEHAEAGTAVAVEVRSRLVKLEQQVMAQYTSMAAYATIAKHDVERVRAESRSDLDRSQAMLIGLIERLRSEVDVRLGRSSASGDLSVDVGTRLIQVEHDLVSATDALQQCIRENQELRSQVAGLLERCMQEQGWLVSSGTTEALSLG
jgi:paraquat-inducible protein B